MTTTQIEILFWDAIQENAVYNKLQGISRNVIHNWRHQRGNKPSIGDMLGVLFQLEKIQINEPNSKP